MKTTIADPLLCKLRGDNQIGANAQFLTGQDATHAQLRDALSGATPGLVVTTSHGRTGPLNDPVAMQRDLGLLVDRTNTTLPIVDLLNAWQPNGAIWYAHACCSAGCDTGSVFADLFRPAPLARTLDSIGKLGAQSGIVARDAQARLAGLPDAEQPDPGESVLDELIECRVGHVVERHRTTERHADLLQEDARVDLIGGGESQGCS